jgi:hypothetical protein
VALRAHCNQPTCSTKQDTAQHTALWRSRANLLQSTYTRHRCAGNRHSLTG